jgi:serine/threonine protein phosphatase PrpC
MSIKTSYLLNIGAREQQQDSCNIFKNDYSTFLVIGDGMGGHKGGAVASQTLVQEAKELYSSIKEKIENPQEFFGLIVNNTILSLKKYAVEHPDTDPQTTCVLALIQDEKVYCGHIGDSRLYIFDNMYLDNQPHQLNNEQIPYYL